MSIEIATELEQRVAASVNAARAAEGLPALKIEAHLNASAQSHSDWMGETGDFSHTGEGGSSATERIDDAAFPLAGSWRTAENIAFSSISGGLDAGEVDRMHEGLMNSPEHLANILDPDVSYVGIGLSIGQSPIDGDHQQMAYLTEDFAGTDGRTLVQEEVDGETVLQPYEGGEPVGEPQPVDTPPDDDPATPDDPKDPNDDQQDQTHQAGAGCFVATAVYGNPGHPDVVDLRRFRDEILVDYPAGRAFVRAYRVVGPKLARIVSAEGASGAVARALISRLARLARARVDRRR